MFCILTMNTGPVIVLFQDDFRINDNPALHYACKNYQNVMPLYIHQNDYLGRELGVASKVFLHKTLDAFAQLLNTEYGTNLIIKCGNIIDCLSDVVEQANACAIYFNCSYTAKQIETQNLIVKKFNKLDVKSFKGKLLFDPQEIKTSSDEPFKVFTPFSKKCLNNLHLIESVLPKPESIKGNIQIPSLNIEDLNLLPKNEGSWHKQLLDSWEFDYCKIHKNFTEFVNNKLVYYADNRNIPSQNGNANISPYLRFGMLSPKICFEAAGLKCGKYDNQFNLELLWREFAYCTMYYNCDIATNELRSEYKEFQWDHDLNFLKKWQRGETGFDIVDAGMNELWKMGVMHGRLRMITSSFLIKDLMIDWRLGEQWFWNCLIDADPAINPFSWQWVFGSGFDGAPYFRIFNPDLQKERFDKHGQYCNKWLGSSYNKKKIVNHDSQRIITLEKYKLLLGKI